MGREKLGCLGITILLGLLFAAHLAYPVNPWVTCLMGFYFLVSLLCFVFALMNYERVAEWILMVGLAVFGVHLVVGFAISLVQTVRETDLPPDVAKGL